MVDPIKRVSRNGKQKNQRGVDGGSVSVRVALEPLREDRCHPSDVLSQHTELQMSLPVRVSIRVRARVGEG